MTSPQPAPTTAERILAGASRALSAQGLRATTVQHILDEAGVARRTFYQHFAGKEAVVETLHRAVADGLEAAVTGAAPEGVDPTQRLFLGIDAYLDLQRDGDALFLLLQAEAMRPGSKLAAYRLATLQRLVDFVAEGTEEATGLRLDPLVFRSLLLAMEGLVIDLHRRGPFGDAERERVGSVMKPLFLQVLMGGHLLPKAAAGG